MEKRFAPNYQKRNFRYNGEFEPEKYNMNFNEVLWNINVLEAEVNENNEIFNDEILKIINENAQLIRQISYLIKKYNFIKKYRYKGE